MKEGREATRSPSRRRSWRGERGRGAGARLATLLLAAALGGCAGWPPSDPLDGLHPYLWLRDGVLHALVCRWPDGARVPVAAGPGATDEDRVLLAEALTALATLGLPVTLVERPGEEAAIRVRFRATPVPLGGLRPGSGRADVACAYAPGSGAAELAGATVHVTRSAGEDAGGRERRLSRPERLGVLVHELAHALGFAGHVRRPDAVLDRAPESLRRLGRRIERGEALESPALRALYRRPSGAVLWTAAVETWRSAPVDGLAARAAAAGWTGPFLRVGDSAASITWLAPEGREPGVRVPELDRVLEQPREVLAVPRVEAAPADPPGGTTSEGPE